MGLRKWKICRRLGKLCCIGRRAARPLCGWFACVVFYKVGESWRDTPVLLSYANDDNLKQKQSFMIGGTHNNIVNAAAGYKGIQANSVDDLSLENVLSKLG